MELLLDTHAFIWWTIDDPALGAAARARITAPESAVFVSAVSVWEIAVKRAAGRLRFPQDVVQEVNRHGFASLSIDPGHALHSAELPFHHRDPFDRMLVAQAAIEELTLVTGNTQIAKYDVRLLDATK